MNRSLEEVAEVEDLLLEMLHEAQNVRFIRDHPNWVRSQKTTYILGPNTCTMHHDSDLNDGPVFKHNPTLFKVKWPDYYH